MHNLFRSWSLEVLLTVLFVTIYVTKVGKQCQLVCCRVMTWAVVEVAIGHDSKLKPFDRALHGSKCRGEPRSQKLNLVLPHLIQPHNASRR